MVLYMTELHQDCWAITLVSLLMSGTGHLCWEARGGPVPLFAAGDSGANGVNGQWSKWRNPYCMKGVICPREVLSKWLCTREGGWVVLVLSCVSKVSWACSGAGVFVAADRAGGCDWFRLNTQRTRDEVLLFHGSVNQASWIPLLILQLSSVTATCSHNIFVSQLSCW